VTPERVLSEYNEDLIFLLLLNTPRRPSPRFSSNYKDTVR